MREVKQDSVCLAILSNMLIFLVISGCATGTLSERVIPQEESQLMEEAEETTMSLYYDFSDVPGPKELDIKKEISFAFQTTEFTAGLLVFSGKVESDSLIRFFKYRMPEDGWRFVSSFKAPKNVIFFLKENRFCIITVVDKIYNTDVEIFVMPSSQGSP